MSLQSIQTRLSSQLLRYADLPSDVRNDLEQRILQFQQDWEKSGTSPLFAPYCEGLEPHARRVLLRELMVEDQYFQHRELDRSLYSTYSQQVETAMVDTLFTEHTAPSDGPYVSPADGETPRIRGFEIQEPIGEGGMAIVYKAIQLRFDRVVAVKIPKTPLASGEDRTRFYDEARLQARYLGAGVPAVFACGFGDYGVPYIAMECIEGQRLEEFFPKGQPDRKQCLEGFRVIAKVCRALAPLHYDRSLHLDLSSGNVFIDKRGNVKILDFGFGYAPGLKPFDAGIAGTPDYMAPEKARGADKYHASTDVYSLGVFLARMATGQTAFPSSLKAEEKIERLRANDLGDFVKRLWSSQKSEKLPIELIKLTEQCLQLDSSLRPADAGEVADCIEGFFNAEEEKLHKLEVQQARRQVWVRSIVAVMVVMALGILFATGFAVWANIERQRAQRNVQLRVDALDTIIGIVGGDTLRKAGQTNVQKNLLNKFIALLDDAAKSENSDAPSREQKAQALNALTSIHQVMQQTDQALQDAVQAEEILRPLTKSLRASPTTKQALAISLSNQATLKGMSGKFEAAIMKATEASGLLSALCVNNASAQLYLRHALVENTLANCLMRQAPPAAENASDSGSLLPAVSPGETHYRNALSHIEQALTLEPDDSQLRAWRVKILDNLALLIRPKPESLMLADQAVQHARELMEDYPDDLDSREGLAIALTNKAVLELNDGKASDAIKPLQEALDLYIKLSAEVPLSMEFKWGMAMAHSNVGDGRAATATTIEELQAAMEDLKKADTIYLSLLKPGGNDQELQLYIAENNERIQSLSKKMQAAPLAK